MHSTSGRQAPNTRSELPKCTKTGPKQAEDCRSHGGSRLSSLTFVSSKSRQMTLAMKNATKTRFGMRVLINGIYIVPLGSLTFRVMPSLRNLHLVLPKHREGSDAVHSYVGTQKKRAQRMSKSRMITTTSKNRSQWKVHPGFEPGWLDFERACRTGPLKPIGLGRSQLGQMLTKLEEHTTD